MELLEKNEILKNQNISLVYENYKEHCELLGYQIIMEGQIYYANKKNYIKLIERYLNQSIDEDTTKGFVSKFCEIFQNDNKELVKIENKILKDGRKALDQLEIHPNSFYFSDLIFEIVESGEKLTFDPSNFYGISPEEFIEMIHKNYLEIKKI
jgi:hypothetical protein